MTEQDGESGGLAPPADADAIRDEQVSRALRRLDDCGGLTPEQRVTVERLADRLTAELLDMVDADEQVGTNADADDGRVRVSGLAVRENHECL